MVATLEASGPVERDEAALARHERSQLLAAFRDALAAIVWSTAGPWIAIVRRGKMPALARFRR
jgi:hypothetical protein